REHGTTRERPADRMDAERPHLRPLPAQRFDAAETAERLIGDDFCVAWDTHRYSVPPRFVGQTARVRVLEGVVEVFVGREAVARHPKRDTRYKRTILPEHEAEFRTRSTSRHVLEEQFLRIGPAARDFADGLIADHGGAAGYHMSRILGLCEKAGIPRVAEAVRHAVRYGAFDFGAVARIVAGRTDEPTAAPPAPGPLPTHIAQYLRGAGDHQRSLRAYENWLRDTKKEPPDGQ
ncbi:MAG: hypothetical protein HYR51_06655, partial [Candidatus Rokubacteria bacterium]|nr:hypothetical protein [Candidatus Rokubacteria bacterium]